MRSLLFVWMVAWAAPVLAHEEGVIHLGAGSVPVGGALDVRGEKLPENSVVRLELRGAFDDLALGDFPTDSTGAFQTRLILPSEAKPGVFAVVAVAPDGDVVARADLLVIAGPSAAPGGHDMRTAHVQATPEMMDLRRTRSLSEWMFILGLIGFVSGAGLAMLLRGSRPRPERDDAEGSEDVSARTRSGPRSGRANG